jgi:glyoxylase-like metal-dependent hydrolase (beta-lactamase superfamily II)
LPAEKLHLLDLGWLGGDIGWFLPGGAGGGATRNNRNPPVTWVEIPVPAAVVEHKDGIVLFDAGTHPDAMKTHTMIVENFPVTRFSKENMLEKQLSLIGFKPEDIHFIVISHLHWDHVGQLGLFKKNVPIIVQKKELQHALYNIWVAKRSYYSMEDLSPLIGAAWSPIEERTLELLDGVTLNWTGGHTPGHQVLKVNLRSGKNYVLTGDYLHIPEEYDLEAKGWLLADAEEWQAYLRQLKLTVMAKKTKLIISHDPKLWDNFPKAPKSLK